MNKVPFAAIIATLLLLASCGDSETSSMSFEDFKAKLENLRESGPMQTVSCNVCEGTGKITEDSERNVTCEECKGKGKVRRKCGFCNGTGTGFDGKPCKDCAGKGWRTDTCPKCNGQGTVVTRYEKVVSCDRCGGKGKYQARGYPTVDQVLAALGEPAKKQEVAGKRYWYFMCKDGMIQVEVSIVGDSVDFGEPNLY